ncbi:mycofactocin-coupled SDR family oxidoreductase [Frankia sp. AiPs1]|uniref:mycofactocin-coupled SDR family oxidoreductase n=1 Tax=Frankia sp. AiPs1 TaxID=573493 RepID=UPI0020448DCA|nr:mycofactocin-coupled SDR family oxidoreductase [Frankia sp. AiPs1]MCM3922199.1 mycofactocin-coupled SDR family oxidoreductase [Frankia sp. AiPs1]
MSRLEGKVALVTGAARGQGRSHAVRLAEEGADLILVDVLRDLPTLEYGLATADDLAATVAAVEAAGRRVVWGQADVRDGDALQALVDRGVGELGRLDIVSANAGISPRLVKLWEITPAEWDEQISVNLTGAFNTIRAVVPPMIAGGRGGAIVLTSSGAGLAGIPHLGAYNASKHGVVGLALTLANELARHDIRVNALCPGTVGTPMVTQNRAQYGVFRPDLEDPNLADTKEALKRVSPLGRPWIEPIDVTNALLWLVSDEGRYVTGITLPIDQGTRNRS